MDYMVHSVEFRDTDRIADALASSRRGEQAGKIVVTA
jgi:hypothetical protein